MNGLAGRAQVSAAVTLAPNRSQTFLVALVVFATIALGFSAWMAAEGVAVWWVFTLIAVVAIALAVWAWVKSQRDIDRADAGLSTLTVPNGPTFSFDSRVVQSANDLCAVWTAISQRHPLPIPDGTVDERCNPIPASAEAAARLVNEINGSVQSNTNDALRHISEAVSGRGLEQRLQIGMPTPPIDAERQTNFIEGTGPAGGTPPA